MTNRKTVFIILAAIILSSIFIYAGHFLSEKQESAEQEPVLTEQDKTVYREPAVKYEHISTTINANKQEINLLTIDVSRSGIKVMPVLSHDLIYGFENLSAMASRKSAYAAVNGGFFHEYGLPSGMVAVDGRMIAGSTGRYPVFTVSGGKAALGEIKGSLWLDYGKGRLIVDKLNSPVTDGEAAVFTPDYGATSRVKAENLTVVIRKGLVTQIGIYQDEVEIPEDGMLITFLKHKYGSPEALPFKVGDAVKLLHDPDLPSDLQAYECGNWLVKDGKSVAKNADEWVGVMTNHDPRTAVGIKSDGKVVLLTVDGRQPGYSAGFTGRELAEYLIGLGVVNAAMLDGGASTEMILKGKLVNKPSFKGQERPLAGGIVVIAP